MHAFRVDNSREIVSNHADRGLITGVSVGRKKVMLSRELRERNRKQGADLLAARLSVGLRQDVVAKKAGISRSQLSRFESGDGPLKNEQKLAVYEVLKLAVAGSREGFTQDEIDAKSADEKAAIVRRWDEGLLTSMSASPGPHASDARNALKLKRRSMSITQQELADRCTKRKMKGITQSIISAYENGYVELADQEVKGLEAALDSVIAERPHALTSWLMNFSGLGSEIPDPEINIQNVGGSWLQGRSREELAKKVRMRELELERSKIDEEMWRLEWELERNSRDPEDVNPDRSGLAGMDNLVKAVKFKNWDEEYRQKRAGQISAELPEEKK
jgi:transcriptional regulator with XRE-family HTH domain